MPCGPHMPGTARAPRRGSRHRPLCSLCHARSPDTITWLRMSPGIGLWVRQMNLTLLPLQHVLVPLRSSFPCVRCKQLQFLPRGIVVRVTRCLIQPRAEASTLLAPEPQLPCPPSVKPDSPVDRPSFCPSAIIPCPHHPAEAPLSKLASFSKSCTMQLGTWVACSLLCPHHEGLVQATEYRAALCELGQVKDRSLGLKPSVRGFWPPL